MFRNVELKKRFDSGCRFNHIEKVKNSLLIVDYCYFVYDNDEDRDFDFETLTNYEGWVLIEDDVIHSQNLDREDAETSLHNLSALYFDIDFSIVSNANKF